MIPKNVKYFDSINAMKRDIFLVPLSPARLLFMVAYVNDEKQLQQLQCIGIYINKEFPFRIQSQTAMLVGNTRQARA